MTVNLKGENSTKTGEFSNRAEDHSEPTHIRQCNRQPMRNFPSKFKEMPRVPDSHRGREWALRTAADYTGVLLELARAQRGFLFYRETDARRRPLAERAHRAICSELRRAGTIALVRDAAGPRFLLPNDVPPIEATGALLDFEKALRRHGVKQLRLDPLLTETAVAGLEHDANARAHPSARRSLTRMQQLPRRAMRLRNSRSWMFWNPASKNRRRALAAHSSEFLDSWATSGRYRDSARSSNAAPSCDVRTGTQSTRARAFAALKNIA